MTDFAEPVAGARGTIARPIGAGRSLPAGGFRFWFADQRWEWSAEVAVLHGYAPGSVTPTTELLLSHKHPDDRDDVAIAIATSLSDAEAFCSRHRIIDTAGNEHQVLVLGELIVDGAGVAVGTGGYYVDLTTTFDEQRQDVLDKRLPALLEARAEIEQAKGVVMYAYRITAEQAFSVLRWRSQETNTKLRVFAAKLLAGLVTLPQPVAQTQTDLDHLLLTCHLRASGDGSQA